MPRRAWLLALIAVAVRAAASLTVVVIESDAARNLRMAELLEHGRFLEGLTVRTPTPPLHPLLTALIDLAIGNRALAGILPSVVLGGMAVLPLYGLVRRIWDDRTATVASALYAFLPAMVDFHCEAITEGTFMFLFFLAMQMGWRAVEERSWELTISTAAVATLAWLTRPEGIYLLPLFAAAVALRFSRFAPLALGLFAATWLTLAFPYLSFIHAQTGRWQVSLSPIPRMISGLFTGETPFGPRTVPAVEYEEYRVIAHHGVVLGGLRLLGSNLLGKVLFYILGPFVVLGLGRPRAAADQRPRLAYLGLALAGYLTPIILGFAACAPFSHRFLLVPATLLLPFAAVGLVRAAEWTKRREALPLLVAGICLAMAVRDFRPRRTDKLGMKEAGLGILRTLGPEKRIFATNGPIEFYARSAYVDLPENVTFEQLDRAAAEGRLDAFAFWSPEDRRYPKLEERIREKYPLLGEFPAIPAKNVQPVRVYRARR